MNYPEEVKGGSLRQAPLIHIQEYKSVSSCRKLNYTSGSVSGYGPK